MKSCLAKDFFVCIFAAAMESIHHFWTVNVGTNTYSYDGYWNSKFIWKVLAYWRKIICEIFIDWNFIGSSKSSFWYKVWTLLFLLVLWSICFGLKKSGFNQHTFAEIYFGQGLYWDTQPSFPRPKNKYSVESNSK